MTHDNSQRALLLAFCAVVICFVGSTVYTQSRVTQLDNAASTIANVATVRIEALASLRAETHDFVQQLNDCIDRAGGELLGCERLRATKEKIEGELQSYRSLPSDPSHLDLREQIEDKIAALLNAVGRTLKEVDRGDRAQARRVYDSEARPALDGTRGALIESIERNAEQARRLALSIRSIRSQSTFAAYALDAMSVILGGIAIALAIAQLRRYTQLMESRRQLLERQAEELEGFAGRVAHDVVGPLSAVSTFLAILDRHLPTADEDKLRFGLDRAKRGLMRSTRIVSDLLDFAKAGARPADGTSAALVEVLEGLAEELKPLAREAGVELRIEFPREPCVVSCSPGVLMSLIDNLARNAIKYTADSQVRRVTIRAQIKRTSVRVEVADTGPGIPAEAQALVFEPFVRTSSAEGKPGTGLGLATVKRLATAHDGSVGVESTPGHGSIFWFELPRTTATGELEDPKHPTGSTAHPA